MSRKPFLVVAAAMLCAGAGVSVGQTAAEIQAAINAAAPGAVIEMPAGTFSGTLVLRPGVVLKGAGAGQTILDAGASGCAISGAKGASIYGLTVRGGMIGFCNRGNACGVFASEFTGQAKQALLISHGYVVAADCRFSGAAPALGIDCRGSNPLVLHCDVQGFAEGFRAAQHYAPVLEWNRFVGNGVGVAGDGTAQPRLFDNAFEGNGQDIALAAVANGVSGADGVAGCGEPRALDEYLALLESSLAVAVQEHPIVAYDLADTEDLTFAMMGFFPWATFSIAPSAPSTEVLGYGAMDVVRVEAIVSAFKAGPPKLLAVENPGRTEQAPERYVLDAIYQHPESFRRDEAGNLVFKRLTNLSRIRVLVPPGYVPQNVSPEMDFVRAGDRLVGLVTDVGITQVEMTLTRDGPDVPDVYGVRALFE